MACLPAAPPALALRRCLGLGLFVLLCLSLGKQERLAWEGACGARAGSGTRVPVGGGQRPPRGGGHSFWGLLPGLRLGQGLGWLAPLATLASVEDA